MSIATHNVIFAIRVYPLPANVSEMLMSQNFHSPWKWGLRNKRRNSILMTYGYPDLGSASDPRLQRGSPSTNEMLMCQNFHSSWNQAWGTSAEIPYWWRMATQIWVLLLILVCRGGHPLWSVLIDLQPFKSFRSTAHGLSACYIFRTHRHWTLFTGYFWVGYWLQFFTFT